MISCDGIYRKPIEGTDVSEVPSVVILVSCTLNEVLKRRYVSTKLRCVISGERLCQMHLESQSNILNKQARLYYTIWQHRAVIINT
jgi:hypothetical protein